MKPASWLDYPPCPCGGIYWKGGGCWQCGKGAAQPERGSAVQDLLAYGITFQKDGERIDPKDVFVRRQTRRS